jgi:hypothetical protein
LAVEATLLGEKRYTSVKPPILAIYATPAPCDPSCKDPVRLFQSRWSAEQADAVQKAYPKARVVRIPLAQHYVFRSHEAEVIRHMSAFMDTLPR